MQPLTRAIVPKNRHNPGVIVPKNRHNPHLPAGIKLEFRGTSNARDDPNIDGQTLTSGRSAKAAAGIPKVLVTSGGVAE